MLQRLRAGHFVRLSKPEGIRLTGCAANYPWHSPDRGVLRSLPRRAWRRSRLPLHEVLSLIGETFRIVLIARIEPFLYGLILVLIMIFFPEGFIPGMKRGIIELWKKRTKRDAHPGSI